MTGKQIKNIRIVKSLTQTEFAKKMNVSKTTICLWENGIKSPSLKSIKKIETFCKRNKIEIGE